MLIGVLLLLQGPLRFYQKKLCQRPPWIKHVHRDFRSTCRLCAWWRGETMPLLSHALSAPATMNAWIRAKASHCHGIILSDPNLLFLFLFYFFIIILFGSTTICGIVHNFNSHINSRWYHLIPPQEGKKGVQTPTLWSSNPPSLLFTYLKYFCPAFLL